MTIDDMHECPATGCAVRVARSKLACSRHWYQLPADIRSAVWRGYRTYRSDNGAAHRAALTAALAWYREHP
jgi:hypothetical protein